MGFIKVDGQKIDFKGSAMHVMALQGMKPHHAGMFFLLSIRGLGLAGGWSGSKREAYRVLGG